MSEQPNIKSAKNQSDGTHSEGDLTKNIEQQTSKVSSHFFLFASVGSMAVSSILEFTGHHKKSQFVGRWAGPLLTIGVYNKIVKLMGSE